MDYTIIFFYILYTKCITYLPIPTIDNIDISYNIVFNAFPQHLLALLLAIFIGNLVDNYIISKLKNKLNGKYLSFCFIVATIIGEFALQVVGTSVAWMGHLTFQTEIFPFIVCSYLYKIIFEVIMTLVNIFVCTKLKIAEGIDIYDKNISYSSFLFHKGN